MQRLLVPTDFSKNAENALKWALYWAKLFDAELHVLHVMDEYNANWQESSDAFSEVPAIRKEVESHVGRGLQAAVPDPNETGIETTTAFRWGHNVANEIHDYADEVDADGIVMGTTGRGWFGSVLLGSVAQQVIKKSRQPVMTIGKKTPKPKDLPIQRLLAPVDFSDHARKATRLAKIFADASEARLDLLFVAEERTVPVFSDTGIPGAQVIRMDPGIVKNSEKALRQFCEKAGGPTVEAQGHFAEGGVAERIVDFAATHDVGLIVMATRGLSGLDRWLMGSVTQRVVRKAPCPVLTLNTKIKDEDEA